jgi:hypothetical protein
VKSLKLIAGVAVLVLGFQNCTQARFSVDNSTFDQKSLGGEGGYEPGDDGNIPGSQPGDDGNIPKGGGPGDDANTPKGAPGDDPASKQICDARYSEVIKNHVPKSLCAEATTVKFMAGQHYYVGDVSFAAKNGNLQIQISLIGNVQMKESHLDIANSPSELEVSPGQFKYNKSYNPLASQYTYSIPLSEANLVVGQTIYARVHAAVTPGKDSILCSEETAWGQGIRSGIGWSMHIPVKITECAN